VAPPGPPRDSYGCGDSFAAAFTFALASEASVTEAADLGARWGAKALTVPGAP
jgi:sugar/nucleoside kinase (ribokinase family)